MTWICINKKVAAVKTDVPRIILSRFNTFFENVQCKLAIACLERDDKENNLHFQLNRIGQNRSYYV